MKKIVLLLIAMIAFGACTDDVQFNTPALQGNKNQQLWRANSFDAVLSENGTLIINARQNSEKITFTLTSFKEDVYSLTDKSLSKIDFTDFENVKYSTSNLPDSESNFYPENGKLNITIIEDNTITGSFSFSAFTADGKKSVVFNDGVIYRISFK